MVAEAGDIEEITILEAVVGGVDVAMDGLVVVAPEASMMLPPKSGVATATAVG